MDYRIAVVGIIIEDRNSAEAVNAILHEYGDHIIGRMGIPHKSRGLNIISVAVDGPQNVINSISGKLGRLSGVSAKAVYSSAVYTEAEGK